LKGAVSDADSIVQFLVDQGAAPERIRNLRNEQATRSAILRELRDLITNSSIEKNDPIVIYFAGKGTRAVRPTADEGLLGSWSLRDQWDPCLAPYDFGGSHVEGGGVYGIPDQTLAAIMHRIAGAKGNNIVCKHLRTSIPPLTASSRMSFSIAATPTGECHSAIVGHTVAPVSMGRRYQITLTKNCYQSPFSLPGPPNSQISGIRRSVHISSSQHANEKDLHSSIKCRVAQPMASLQLH
jgi:Caspase domain